MRIEWPSQRAKVNAAEETVPLLHVIQRQNKAGALIKVHQAAWRRNFVVCRKIPRINFILWAAIS
jgi:hypothetical protein